MAGRQSNDHVERPDEAEAESTRGESSPSRSEFGRSKPTFSVRLPIVVNTEEYEIFPDEYRVRDVLEERQWNNDELYYTCRFEDGHVAEVSLTGVGSVYPEMVLMGLDSV